MKVFLYARVSTPEQAKKDLSIPDQLRQMREYCQQNNYAIIQEYVEPGVTATDDNKRPVFMQMIDDALSKEYSVDAILVLTTSRFFRDSFKAKFYKRALKKKNIKVIAIRQRTDDSPTGNLTENFFELIDQYESEMTAFHTLRGMKENARKGYLNGASAPYGYKKIRFTDGFGNQKSKLEIDPIEAEVVKKIFTLYLQGDQDKQITGSKSLASCLNRQGITNRQGKRWEKQRILDILSNPVYIGKYFFNKYDSKAKEHKPETEWIQISVPAIISQETFDKAQEIIRKRDPQTTNPAITASPSLLLGLIKCGSCGASMTRETGKSNEYSYYNCRTFLRQGKDSCAGQRIPRELLERQVLDHMANKIFTFKRTKKMLSELYKAYAEARRLNDEKIETLKKDLADTESRLKNQYEAIERGIIELNDVAERIRELKQKKAQTETALERARNAFTVPMRLYTQRNITTFQNRLKKTFINEGPLAKSYLNRLIERITIKEDNVHIEGRIRGVLSLMQNPNPETPTSPQKETAASNPNTGVLTAVSEWLPLVDSNHGPGGYT